VRYIRMAAPFGNEERRTGEILYPRLRTIMLALRPTGLYGRA